MDIEQLNKIATPAQRDAATGAANAAWNAEIAAAKKDDYVSRADWQAAFNDAYTASVAAYAKTLRSLLQK